MFSEDMSFLFNTVLLVLVVIIVRRVYTVEFLTCVKKIARFYYKNEYGIL